MKLKKKQIIFLPFLSLLPFLSYNQALANKQADVDSYSNIFDKIDLSALPKPAQWKPFMQAPIKELLTFLQSSPVYSPKSGLNTKKVRWEWRMGIVRKCESSNDDICRKLLISTLNDPALVVRNQAVTSFANRYRATGNQDALSILEHVFADPKNSRNGEPLFVKKKILYSIHQIGGVASRSLGHRLSSDHKELKNYWSKL